VPRAFNAARTWAPPILTFVVARLVLLVAAVHAHKGFPGAVDLSRADSFNYLSIAAHGYVLHPCPPHCVPGVSLPWTGNSGWFPLYPLILAPFALLHVGAAAGAVVAAVCQLGTFAILWFGFIRGCPRVKAVLLMVLAAVFPGAVYLSAVFPLSLLTLLFLAGLWFLREGNARGVVAVAFLATLTYPLGFLFGPAAFIATRRRGTGTTAAVMATGVALALVVGVQQLMTGHWNAYLLSQSGRGHQAKNPLDPLLDAKASTLSFLHEPTLWSAVPALETTLVLCIVLAAVAGVWPARRSVPAWSALTLVLFCWLEPLVLGGVSLYRTDVALLPAVILLRRLPVAVVAAFVLAAAPIAYWMAVLYFRAQLN
jgi:hypothetical protein